MANESQETLKEIGSSFLSFFSFLSRERIKSNVKRNILFRRDRIRFEKFLGVNKTFFIAKIVFKTDPIYTLSHKIYLP